MPTNDNASGNAEQPAGNTTESAQSTPGAAQGGAQDYKALYEGLKNSLGTEFIEMSRYQALQRTHQGVVDTSKTITSERDALKEQLAQTKVQHDLAAQEIARISAEKNSFEQKVGTLNATIERHKLLMEKYPQLAPFEAQGLIPMPSDGNTNDLIFQKFSEQMSKLAGDAKKDFGKGGVPNEPAGNSAGQTPQATATALLAQATEAALKGDTATYDRLMNDYYKAQS